MDAHSRVRGEGEAAECGICRHDRYVVGRESASAGKAAGWVSAGAVAENKVYGMKDVAYSGPVFDSVKEEGDKLKVTFKETHGGLVAKGEKLVGFYVAGEDKSFTRPRRRSTATALFSIARRGSSGSRTIRVGTKSGVQSVQQGRPSGGAVSDG